MSRFGESKGAFGAEGTKAYYKAQAPPGGKSSIFFGGDEPAPAATKKQEQPAAPTLEKDNSTLSNKSDSSQKSAEKQSDAPQINVNTYQQNKQRQQQSTLSLGGNYDNKKPAENKPVAAKPAAGGTENCPPEKTNRDPILPKAQLDMKSNEYPKETEAKNDAKPSTRVAQPPGGYSRGLW